MKRVGLIIVLMFVVACSSESANDCFQTTGTITQVEVDVTDFEKILVNRDIELVLIEGAQSKVVIETGENLQNDIEVTVVDNQLQLTDNNTCNYVRDYGITKIYVTSPNVREIRSSTQYDISSEGVLNYADLHLISEDFIAPDTFTVGDFKLEINSSKLTVTSNNISSFYVSGEADNLVVGFYAGASRFEGENLVAQHVRVFHRGSNDMLINPQQSISGELRGAGDLIAFNQPANVMVEQFYIGQLIFED